MVRKQATGIHRRPMSNTEGYFISEVTPGTYQLDTERGSSSTEERPLSPFKQRVLMDALSAREYPVLRAVTRSRRASPALEEGATIRARARASGRSSSWCCFRCPPGGSPPNIHSPCRNRRRRRQ